MKQIWLDRPAPYEATWRAMQDFTDARDADTPDVLWLVEHEPVYTLGQAGRPEHILNPHGIPVVHCDRGGQVTYHGPGQVLLYTLVDLQRAHLTVHGYVTLLEQTVLDTLESFSVAGCRKVGAPGVYVAQSALQAPHGTEVAKIAALGLKIRHGRAYHGIALNVEMDLSPFSGINPCGYAGLQTVDLAACGVHTDLVTAGERLATCFQAAWEHTQAALHEAA